MTVPMPHVEGMSHRDVHVRGLRFHVATGGPPDAPPVVLLHGWPQHWFMWRHVIPLLIEDHRLIVPDLRGLGWSDAPRKGYRKQELADDVLAVLAEMGVERFDLIGHDWGAFAGFLLCASAPDRVAHTLLDGIVENYKPALEELAYEIAELEQLVIAAPSPKMLNKIIQIKKEVLHLRQIIGPQREVLARFARGEFKLIRPHLVPYYRNVYDALFHISELAQNYTDSLTGLLHIYLNMSSNQTGEVVKLLTLITVITTPLTIVGTWYGMNFKQMPELDMKHGYALAIGIVFTSTAMTWWWFRKKKWF
jgi:magnesium/cobalt transport protein CorA